MTKSTRRTRRDGYRLRPGDQIPTRPTTTIEIMSAPAFALGVADVRAGRGPRAACEGWSVTNDQWSYERGRMWARQAPRTVALKRNGKVTEEAMRWYTRDII
jgi:hypothetical protein